MIRRSRFLLVALAVVAVGFAARAEADVLCKNKGGAVHIRAACKAQEAVVSPSDLGVASASDQHSAVWRDANGVFVGNYLRSPGGNNGLLVHDTAGRTIEVMLGEDGQLPWGEPTFYFTSGDCSGQRLLLVGDTGPEPVHGPDSFNEGIGYYAVGLGADATVASSLLTQDLFASQNDCDAWFRPGTSSSFVPPHSCCVHQQFGAYAHPALSLDLTAYVQPFHIDSK